MKTEDLFFIDYEYSAYNNRAFDVGNYFAEWMYNYKHTEEVGGYSEKLENYPSLEHQKDYAIAYFEETGEEGDIDQFLKEARQFTLVSHCFWSIWCLINSNDDVFDYIHYANCRLNHFFQQLESFR